MSRISRVGRSEVSGAARDVFERQIAERGRVPNLYRVVAHRPWHLTTMDAHLAAVMCSGAVPLKLKQLLALQPSIAKDSASSGRSRAALAVETGATEEQIAALLDFENGPFEEKVKAALRYGLQVSRDAGGVSDELFADLARYFDEGEIVEITCVIGLSAYFHHFREALRTEPTQPGDGVDS